MKAVFFRVKQNMNDMRNSDKKVKSGFIFYSVRKHPPRLSQMLVIGKMDKYQIIFSMSCLEKNIYVYKRYRGEIMHHQEYRINKIVSCIT